jgi:hypothetical protein
LEKFWYGGGAVAQKPSAMPVTGGLLVSLDALCVKNTEKAYGVVWLVF